jgi:phytoene dehydrogenase-like protein
VDTANPTQPNSEPSDPSAPQATSDAPATTSDEPATLDTDYDTIIVGAGLAGLACARDLTKAGQKVKLLEASDAPGGRVRTDIVDGFRLDRGFQVLLTEYPEARRVLDFDSLALKNFVPGALVRRAGSFHRFADPYRELQKGLAFAFDSVVPLSDKLKVAKLRKTCLKTTDAQLFATADETTQEWLRRAGFSPAIMERFFQPFFGGIFLERNLTTSARWFRWLFKMFATGFAAVPELGMEQIPQQMVAALPKETLQCGAPVTRIERVPTGWKVEAGTSGAIKAAQFVLAAREPEAKQLLQQLRQPGPGPARAWNRTTTIYYAANHAPVDEAIIVLNGDGPTAGPVNHLAVMSLASAAYAPPGAHLICANIIGSSPETDEGMETLESEVRNQLRRWFGNQVNAWGVLAGYPIANALPQQNSYGPLKKAPADNGVVLCGDYLTTASIQGALLSGSQAAASILEDRVRPN